VIVDYHMHLRRRRADGVEEIDHTVEAVERYVEVAAERSVDEIGFTEHVYYFKQTSTLWSVPDQIDRCRFDLDSYCDAIVEAKSRGLPVKLGIEVDFVRGREHKLAEVLAPYPWDFQLASVHWIDGAAVDQDPGIWNRMPVEGVWRLYFEHLCSAAASGLFDALSHPDLPKIFRRRPAETVTATLHESVVEACAASGVAVEISTAGLHKPVGELYPDRGFLKACCERGVPVTLASDAHAPENVGRDLDRAVEHARGAGYDTVTVFDGRQARQAPLG
jgi:histidinol-phosphatase (PHP family)